MSIEKKVLEYLTKTAAGKKKIETAIAPKVKAEAEKLAQSVRNVQEELPFDFGVDTGKVDVAVDSSGRVIAKCDIVFDHEDARRESFYTGGSWSYADLIYLLNNGWAYESEKPPKGMWHGNWTTALTERDGLHFVQKAVEDYTSSSPAGVKVKIADEYS